MKKRILVLSSVLLALFFVSGTIRKSSSGAPPSHTGAPGEKTCATAGCHDDNRINSGTAQLSLELGEGEKTFIPGHTYPVKVKITDPKVNRFGFQIVALETKSLRDMGSFLISDSTRTKVVTNQYDLKDRNYITYTFNGTDAVKEGLGEWTINWTAPTDAKKAITFYLAAVSGNDDMTDKGDKVYTSSYTFKQAHLK
jgi:hypothetical protein